MLRVRLSPGRLWSVASAAALVFLFPLASSAQPGYSPDNDDAYSATARQQLQDLSVRLESLAIRTRQEARLDARHHGSDELAERMDDFAKQSHVLRVLTHERGVPMSKINDQVRKLVDTARKVQDESAKAERHDPQTDSDWNQTMRVLDNINSEHLAANGVPTARGAYGPTYGPNGRERGRDWSETQRTLVADLDRRADDAARLSESTNLDVAPEIDRLRDQVRSFRRDADALSPADRRANIAHMLSDARAAQADLSGSNAPPQLRDDVNAIVGTLVQMRDTAAEGAEPADEYPRPSGTSGYGAPPGVASDRVESVPDMAQDLDARAQRATELATQYDLDEVSNDIAHFRDRVRDFDDRAQDLSPHERRETIDSLLRDAQKTQRDLASRHASRELAAQWDGIIDLLARMRDRTY